MKNMAIRYDKKELISLIQTKLSGDNDELELLMSEVSAMNDAEFTDTYCQSILRMHPELVNAGKTPKKVKRGAGMQKCPMCSGLISNGVCRECNHSPKMIESKSKGSSDIGDKMAQFDDEILKLLAITPLPTHIIEKKDEIVSILKGMEDFDCAPMKNYRLMREAFAKVKLNTSYVWCNAMWYSITGWRPMAFSQEELALLRSYYQTAIQAFYRQMNKATGEMSNLWAMQSTLRLIFNTSSKLMRAHLDFFITLHAPHTSTEAQHTAKWNEIINEERLNFE